MLFAWVEIKGLFKSSQSLLQMIVFVLLTCIAGLRYETGVDWKGYEDYFNSIVSFDKAFNYSGLNSIFVTLDIGYSLLNSIVKMLGGGIQTIFFIVALASNILLLKNLRYYTKYVLTGYLIYYSFFFIVFDMSGLRQGLALQIIFYSYRFIVEHNFRKFIVGVIIAGSIHWTAFVLVFLYFFSTKSLWKYSNFILFLSLIIFILNLKFLSLIIPDIGVLFKGNVLLSERLLTYSSEERAGNSGGLTIMGVFNIIRVLVIFIFLKRTRSDNQYFKLFTNLFLLEIIFIFGLSDLSEISERMRSYFLTAEIVLLIEIIRSRKAYFYKDLTFCFIVLITFFNSGPFLLQFPSTIAYFPYQNYAIYKIFNIRSTGPERLRIHADTH